ncbi:MAG TPA: hypothetical protein VFL90_16895 [Methylomirabilota bacterium]|nr:hypothetical protein [Methylomirabilota bacterium]
MFLLVGAPATGAAQVFLASEPHPEFAIGPLFVNVVVRPDLAPVTVTVSWSLTAPRHRRAADIKEDLYLLWPAELAEATAPGPADPELIAYVEQRSFAVVGSGRLTLAARDRLQMGTGTPATPLPEAASYVTFVRRSAPQLGVGTYVKIPWTPKLADPLAVTVLVMTYRGLVTPKPATWFEEGFWGRRWILSAGFGDLGALVLPLYPLYFEQRDRVVRLAREFSLVVASFADGDHLRVEAIEPPSATRRPGRVRTGSEVISMPLQPTEGVVPQMLKVQFSYFSGTIAWRPIVVSLVLLALGNVAGFIMLSRDVGRVLRARLHLRRPGEPEFARAVGGALPPAVADKIIPGSTTEEEVRALCGHPDEEGHRRGPSMRRMLIYHGVRRVARSRLVLGPLAAVDHWEEEHHELEIELDGGRVSAVQSHVRRQRVTG